MCNHMYHFPCTFDATNYCIFPRMYINMKTKFTLSNDVHHSQGSHYRVVVVRIRVFLEKKFIQKKLIGQEPRLKTLNNSSKI